VHSFETWNGDGVAFDSDVANGVFLNDQYGYVIAEKK
jgi:hypothetical protein